MGTREKGEQSMTRGQKAFLNRIFGNPNCFFDEAAKRKVAREYSREFGEPEADLLAALPPMSVPAIKSAKVDAVLKSASAAPDRLFHFNASTASIDRMGDTLAVKGWDLKSFRANPVVLFAHDSGSLPVGKALAVSITDKALVTSIKFAQTGMGKAVAALLSGGFLNAVSVGFRPTEFNFSKDPSRKGGIDFTKQELLEISVVPIPANSEALLTGISDGAKSFAAPKAQAKAKRERELELIKLRLPPASPKVARMAEVAAIRRRTK
jgi:HK97 family phage prohead protease